MCKEPIIKALVAIQLATDRVNILLMMYIMNG